MSIRFAKYVFGISAIFGFLFLLPLYFAENYVAAESPPAITHPEFYYGFVGVALIWQFVYFMIATNPVRFRPIMILAGLAKFSLVLTFFCLFLVQRVSAKTLAAAVPDFLMALLFFACFFATKNKATSG